MPKRIKLSFIFILLLQMLFGQNDSLHLPLDIPLYLSGTFGELRSNHFHSGLDIKTNNEEGLPVYAVDDGYVYRIKITRNGYGKALYIKHPSGLVSVYGHLKYFNNRIESYIKQKQYKKQKFEIEVFPYKIELPVKKGEIIAYSGNTGGSSGPHLHFELRNIKEHPLNPMLYGIRIKDTESPIVKNVFAYPLDSLSQIDQIGHRIKLNLTQLNDSLYLADPLIADGQIGLGIEAYDPQNFVKNHNGLYKVKVKVNGLPVYEHVMSEFCFANSKYINVIIDYPYYLKYHRRIQKLWVVPYNPLEIYTQLVGDGSIQIKPGQSYQISIELSDFNQNKTLIKIPVKGYKTKILERNHSSKTPYFIDINKNNNINLSPWRIIFRPHTAYQKFYLKAESRPTVLNIKQPYKALQKSYIIKYPLKLIKPKRRPYAYIALYGKKGHTYYVYTIKAQDSLKAYTKRFGNFVIRYDSIGPYIKPLNFKDKSDLTNYHFLKFKIGDKKTGIKAYNGYIDGAWILLEYDYKKGTLTYDFSDQKLKGHKHQLKIIVEDNMGNVRQYQSYFYKKE